MSYKINEHAWLVALVSSSLPQFVQTGTAYDERRINLQTVRSKRGVSEKFLKNIHIEEILIFKTKINVQRLKTLYSPQIAVHLSRDRHSANSASCELSL